MAEASFDTRSDSMQMLQPQYMQRTPNFYAVSELEMDMLATWNDLSALAFTLAGSFLSFGSGIWVQSTMAPVANSRAQAIVALGVPGSFLLAIACAITGIYMRVKRVGTLRKIKTESRELPSRTVA